jgi:hypothetical protein
MMDVVRKYKTDNSPGSMISWSASAALATPVPTRVSMPPSTITVTGMTPRFPRRLIKAETLETVAFVLSPPTPSGLVLSFMPSLSVLIFLELLHLAIPLCLPLLPITLTAFQLLLCLLHHRKRIAARYPLSLSINTTRIFVAPDVLTLNLGEHQLTCRLVAAMAVAVVTRRSIPGLVHSIAVPGGVAEAHTLRLLLVALLAL